ncbi:MAG: hypothetical protein A2W91_01480 [Bacteroidetes bacterium GWF2_38_335]|nr:MAG: hypothetical protein A2W91_01480 [Bacteroidetes bacterium GWF2_38_335]OFY78746.1 MAG: hypothetical protein A2281_19055 [Bacteroidetes bacterium RIFOXYA12_FULL_38_20]HBS85134.1 hypothetical protein [Bacteroidales bacterium]
MLIDVIKNTLIITGFVLVMMLIIEYVNVQTKGKWSIPLKKNPILQILVATILGLTPGCLGTYTVVSLYTHNLMSFGALMAAMIATTGDEAFVMFSVMPETAVKLNIILLVLAVLTGFVFHYFIKKKNYRITGEKHMEIHDHEFSCKCYDRKKIIPQLKGISVQRGILITALVLFILAVSTGNIAHDHNHSIIGMPGTEKVANDDHSSHEYEAEASKDENHDHGNFLVPIFNWNWFLIVFLGVLGIALFIVSTVPDHFLHEHLWGHIVKKHFLKIFLWTFGALLLITWSMEYVDLAELIKTQHIYVLLIAILIGVIPESGPHLVFISLFLYSGLPFSILMANSVVQDGHGALPLFAESKRSFLYVKLIKIGMALILGFAGFYFGF